MTYFCPYPRALGVVCPRERPCEADLCQSSREICRSGCLLLKVVRELDILQRKTKTRTLLLGVAVLVDRRMFGGEDERTLLRDDEVEHFAIVKHGRQPEGSVAETFVEVSSASVSSAVLAPDLHELRWILFPLLADRGSAYCPSDQWMQQGRLKGSFRKKATLV